jgi:hypothetical protein
MIFSLRLCVFAGNFFLTSFCIPLLSLTCPYTGVYIAALPGKKAAGVCRTKRGNYGRAVIETN